MSVAYKPVGWNTNKIFYDLVVGIAVVLYLVVFMSLARRVSPDGRWDDASIEMRAYGSCAFLMLTLILCIGPLTRLDKRFLPLLYNRRHFGVMTCLVALMHARHVLAWYFAFSPIDPYIALLSSNTSYGRAIGFPFEAFGICALAVLLVLAATSHDFWLNFLSPPVWKAMHMSIYAAYACVVAHVSLGALLTSETHALHFIVPACACCVACLHVVAGAREVRQEVKELSSGWIRVGPPERVAEGRAVIVPVAGQDSVAIFRHEGRFSAIANACKHQNGPLGEGRIIDGCVTCPWHGYQYRLEDGCAPAPYMEKLATYDLRLIEGEIWLDPKGHAPGTRVEPLRQTETA